MDAWAALIEHSALPTGDAYEHLLAQSGGGVGTVIMYGNLEVEVDCADFTVDIISDTFDIELDNGELVIEIEEPEYIVEICNG